MSSTHVAPDTVEDSVEIAPVSRLSADPTTRIDIWLQKMSEYVSPILVKETRQAIKSRQFFWTFMLLLVAAVGWSMLGFSMSNVLEDSEFAGRRLLTGYWAILGIPLIVVIPFAVFRSLASEFEDDTLQLMSITTMKPWQIILGKLGSAILQMVIYFSILAPCISFTYLLRGVDLEQIGFGLILSFLISLGLSTIGLFLAGMSTSNVFRVFLSVLFILGLFSAYWGFTLFMYEVNEGILQQQLFSVLLGSCASIAALGFLAFSASTAQITFAADNRSTINRVAMLVVNAVLISMFALSFAYQMVFESVVICSVVCFHMWMIFGCMMVGESPFMSPRVRRMLPKSLVSRSLFSFLLPGPGRGYLFAITNIWGWSFIFGAFMWFGDSIFTIGNIRGNVFTPNERWNACISVFVNATYASFFLSLVYTIFLLIWKKRASMSPFGGAVLCIVIVTLCTLVSLILHFTFMNPARARMYSHWQILNWYWTLAEWVDGSMNGTDVMPSVVLFCVTLLMMLICVCHASRELKREQMAKPKRVVDDDLEQLPSYVPPTDTIDTIFAERESERAATKSR